MVNMVTVVFPEEKARDEIELGKRSCELQMCLVMWSFSNCNL